MKLTQKQFATLQANGLCPENHTLSGFAEACFNMNSADELMDFATADADATDMREWDINVDEWRAAQREALEFAMFNYDEMGDY